MYTYFPTVSIHLLYPISLGVVAKSTSLQTLINHSQRCGMQQAKAMLVQHCPPCLLVKGTSALHWKRLMCSRYLLVNNIASSQNSQCVLTEGKQML